MEPTTSSRSGWCLRFHFFVINLGMGLTRMNVLTYAAVSWIGMLIGTFLYVNAGTALASIDSARAKSFPQKS